MKKKVLFTATVDSHILLFHLPYLKLFKEMGYEVHVATNSIEPIPYCDIKHKVSFERKPFKFKNIKAKKELEKILEKEHFNIIHTHTPVGSVITRLAAKKERKNGTRVIYTAHGFHFYKGSSFINWLLFYPIEKYLAKYTDTLITINDEDYSLAKKHFNKRCQDIIYVPGVGLDKEKYDIKMSCKEKELLRKELGIRKKDFVIIYPAELSKRKGQLWLIKVIKNILKEKKDIHLLLPGTDSLNNKCQLLVQKLHLEKQIHLLGYRSDINRLLKIADLAVSVSKQEGLPLNIMEAMYINIPILASNCRGNNDLVIHGKNGLLFEINDSKTFINYLLKLKGNKKMYQELTKENINMLKPYMLDKIILKMNKIYFK